MFNVLKYLREEHSISQEELARNLNITRQTISKYENGDINISRDNLKKISEYFEVDYACLVDNTKPKETTYNIIEGEKVKISEPDIRINIPQENISKFKQVLLYILNKVGAKPNVGQTVIYKLLYFIDFDYYELYEKQLMGLKYIKNTYGPTPVDFAKLVKNMEKEGMLEEIKTKYFNKDQTKYLPIIKADLSSLTAQEIKHIDSVLTKLSDKTGKELSELSHKDIPWIGSKEGEVIEYEAVFYRSPDTSVREYND